MTDGTDQHSGDIILEAINEKLGQRTLVCPISGAEATWQVEARMAAVRAVEDFPTSIAQNGSLFPLAVVTCQHCGYTIFVNLIALGVAPKLNIAVQTDA